MLYEWTSSIRLECVDIEPCFVLVRGIAIHLATLLELVVPAIGSQHNAFAILHEDYMPIESAASKPQINSAPDRARDRLRT